MSKRHLTYAETVAYQEGVLHGLMVAIAIGVFVLIVVAIVIAR